MVNPSEFKLVLLGSSGVGKTSLIGQFMDGTFNRSVRSTVEMAYRTKTLRVDDRSVKLNSKLA